MADSVNDVVTRVQSKLNDRLGRTFDLAYLLEFINGANENVAMRMIQNGSRQLRDSTVLTVPASVTVLDKTTTPSLPADLQMPIALRERATGSQDRFIPIIDKRDLDPSITATDRLRYWDWRANQIRFVGASVSTDVLLSYFFMPAKLTVGTDEFQYVGMLDPLSAAVAYESGKSRGTLPPPDVMSLKADYEANFAAAFGEDWKQNVTPQVGR